MPADYSQNATNGTPISVILRVSESIMLSILDAAAALQVRTALVPLLAAGVASLEPAGPSQRVGWVV